MRLHMEPPRNFKSRSAHTSPVFSCGEGENSDSLNSSWDSLKSEGSMELSWNFSSRSAHISSILSHRPIKRSDSPEASHVYTKKEGSTDPILNLDDNTIPVLSYRLDSCGISEERSASLKSTLSSNPSHLRNPHLYRNKIRRHSW